MALVASLAGRLARVAMVAPAVARIKSKVARMITGGLLLVLLGSIGVIYLLAAFRVELERYLGVVWPPVIIGVLFCVFAGIAYLMFLRPRRSDARAAEAEDKKVMKRFVRPAQRVEGKIAARPWLSFGGSLATGFAAAYLLHLLRGGKNRKDKISPQRVDDGATRQPWTRQVEIRETEPRKTNSGFGVRDDR